MDVIMILNLALILIVAVCVIVLTYGSRQLDKEMQKGIEMENKIREEMLKHVQEKNKED